MGGGRDDVRDEEDEERRLNFVVQGLNSRREKEKAGLGGRERGQGGFMWLGGKVDYIRNYAYVAHVMP